ncbi:MAG: hypothetical protein ACR2O3_18265 [Rhizobiaceae bacterium]
MKINRLSHEIILQRAMILLASMLFSALRGTLVEAHFLLDFRASAGCASA